MQTRIIFTKIHDDRWIRTLKPEQKWLFVYYFTNYRIGHTGIYEVPADVVSFESGLPLDKIHQNNKVFEENKKVLFHEDWIYVPKASFYGGYAGPKNEQAWTNEKNKIPMPIWKYFNDTLSILYPYPTDTTINHKSKTIAYKPKTSDTKDYEIPDNL